MAVGVKQRPDGGLEGVVMMIIIMLGSRHCLGTMLLLRVMMMMVVTAAIVLMKASLLCEQWGGRKGEAETDSVMAIVSGDPMRVSHYLLSNLFFVSRFFVFFRSSVDDGSTSAQIVIFFPQNYLTKGTKGISKVWKFQSIISSPTH